MPVKEILGERLSLPYLHGRDRIDTGLTLNGVKPLRGGEDDLWEADEVGS